MAGRAFTYHRGTVGDRCRSQKNRKGDRYRLCFGDFSATAFGHGKGIPGSGPFGGLVNRIGQKAHAHNQYQGAKNGTDDFVNLKRIHFGLSVPASPRTTVV